MSWFNVDDKAHYDDRFRRVGLDGFGLYAAAGSYCMDKLTDGFVPDWFIDGWPGGPEAAEKLVAVGIWAYVDGGCQNVEWKEALTRAYVEARKAKWAKDKRQQRSGSSVSEGVSEVDSTVDSVSDALEVLPITNNQDPMPNDQPPSGRHVEEGVVGGGEFFDGPPCDDCDLPALPGKTVCETHLRQQQAQVALAKRGRDAR